MLTGKSKPRPDRIEPLANALMLEGVVRDQFIDSAKRAKSHEDIDSELQDLRKKHEDLLSRHEALRARVLSKMKSKI